MLQCEDLVVVERANVIGREAQQLRHLMEQKGPRQAARPASGRIPVAEFGPHRCERGVVGELAVDGEDMSKLAGSPLGGRPVEQQTQCQEIDDPRRYRLDGSPIGPLLQLPHHACPALECDERLGDEILPCRLGHAELTEFAGDHVESDRLSVVAAIECLADVSQPAGERAAPGLHGTESSRVHAGHGCEESLIPVGHRPCRHALIEKRGDHANQQRVDQRVGVERGHTREE